jgi:putative transposase
VFENALERVRRSFCLRVYGYVVMPEHIYLLVSEPGRTGPLNPNSGLNGPPSLADAIKSLKHGVARRLIGDAEHFWQKRYYDFKVRDHAQFCREATFIGIRSGPKTGRVAAFSITAGGEGTS